MQNTAPVKPEQTEATRVEDLQCVWAARLEAGHIESPEEPERVCPTPGNLSGACQENRRRALRPSERRID